MDTIDNGTINYTTNLTEEGYSFDTLAELHCDPGYKPSVSSQESRRCEQSGNWNGQTQTCIGGNENRIFSFRESLIFVWYYPVMCVLTQNTT